MPQYRAASLALVGALLLILDGCGGGAATVASGAPTNGSQTPPTGGTTTGGGSGTTGGGTGSTGGTTAPTVHTDVLTSKNDLGRTGQNLTESVLTLANVNSTDFGLLHNLPVDGKVDAQPLYLSGLQLSTGTRNVVFVATEGDSVYAFDADTGDQVWKVSVLRSGETLSDDHGCGQVTPHIGITSTPVIDRNAGPHGALYVVGMSKDASSAYHQRLHALDVTSGAELFNGPVEISASYKAANGNTVTFDPGQYAERAALLLSHGVVYTSWTSHCDFPPYTGWVIGYDQKTLAQTGVLSIGPNSNRGPSIWMSGGGPGADGAGNIYLLSANGAFETTLDSNGFPSGQDFGNSFLKLAPAGTTLGVADYFTMSNELDESATDMDLGSGGEMLLPDLTDSAGNVRHLVVGAGKDRNIYVVDRDSMGKFNAGGNKIWQQLNTALQGPVFSSPAYFNGTVYYAEANGSLKAFPITNAKLNNASSAQSLTQFPFPGASPVVSANGTANGIVWAHENSATAVLHAYDAANLAHELYNSNQAGGSRDHFGTGNKFITPTVVDGKVFVGTQNSVAVFGLLH
jgi:hypothetical protein